MIRPGSWSCRAAMTLCLVLCVEIHQQSTMPETVNEFDLLVKSWPIGSCPDYCIEGDCTAESGFFSKGHRDLLVMFLVIKIRRLIGVLASGWLTISGLVSTIRVFSEAIKKIVPACVLKFPMNQRLKSQLMKHS